MRYLWVVGLLAGPAVALAAPAAEHKGSQASPDWQKQVIKATGQGAPDIRRTGQSPAAARIQAEKAAELDALRNVLAKVKGLSVSGGQTVADKVSSDSALEGRLEGVVRGFKITDKRYFSDGGVEVDVEVALGDVLSELFGTDVGSKVAQAKPVSASSNSGLIVDAKGLKVQPALAPHLLDESGKPVYGVENIASDSVKQHGVAGYLKGLDDAKKNALVGEKPLVVKAIKVSGTDLTLSNADAAKVRDASFLSEGRVIIVAD
jgi:hypothetical protein